MANKPTSAGQLYESVAWDERPTVLDGYGNETGEFAEVFRCRAAFTFLRGGESVIAARLEGRQPVVVRVRSTSQTRLIEPDWRMRDLRTGDAYAVRSISPTPDRRWLDVLVEKGVAA